MRHGAFAFVQQEDRVLLVQRREDGRWELPGGVVERGERWRDAVVRELGEETTLVGDHARLAGIWGRWRNRRPELATVWHVDVSGAPAATEEVSAFRWCDPTELPTRMSPHVRRRIGAIAGASWPRLGLQLGHPEVPEHGQHRS